MMLNGAACWVPLDSSHPVCVVLALTLSRGLKPTR